MKIRSIYGLAAAGILFCACQSNTFQIDGFARSFAEGDTICLMKEGGQPMAISTVSNGKFSFKGYAYATKKGAGTDEVQDMVVGIIPSTPITFAAS